MATTKSNSFIVYCDLNDQLQLLSDEEAGIVFKNIIGYGLTGQLSLTDNKAVNVVLVGMATQIDRNKRKYEEVRAKRSAAGKKGNEHRWHHNDSTEAEVSTQAKKKASAPDKGNLGASDSSIPVKEKKASSAVKHTRVASVEDRKSDFIKSMEMYTHDYDADMLNDFYRYWTELNKQRTKMRFEMQKTWEVGKRLAMWSRKSYNQA